MKKFLMFWQLQVLSPSPLQLLSLRTKPHLKPLNRMLLNRKPQLPLKYRTFLPAPVRTFL